MFKVSYVVLFIKILICTKHTYGWNGYSNLENDCGPYGFTCERNDRVRLCEGTKFIGPAFVCPRGAFCNEESTNICEDIINYIDPALTKKLRCNRNERVANPNVAGCKGYILCVLNGNRFQHINFKCSGNTIFNGLTRTCTSPSQYKCPIANVTKTAPDLYHAGNQNSHRPASIECKNYKFRVTENNTPSRAAYFCPPRPVKGQETIWCTIFSNDFCVTLEKDNDDQYVLDGTPYRRPRM